MTTASLRSTVKARLVTVFADVLEGWQVSYGVPRTPLRELVVLHDVRTTDDQPAALTGATSRKPAFDDFSIEGVIGCRQIGQTAQAGEERVEVAYDLMKNATVDPTVAGPSLQGNGTYAAITGLLWVWLRPGDLLTDGSEQGYESTFTFFVDCRTRLT